jgi:hypothetical protein
VNYEVQRWSERDFEVQGNRKISSAQAIDAQWLNVASATILFASSSSPFFLSATLKNGEAEQKAMIRSMMLSLILVADYTITVTFASIHSLSLFSRYLSSPAPPFSFASNTDKTGSSPSFSRPTLQTQKAPHTAPN